MLSTHFELKIWGQFVYTGVSFLKHRPVYSVNSYLCFFLLRPPHHPPLVCISFSGHLGGQKILQFFPLCLDLLCLVPCIPAGGGLAGTDMSSLVLSLPSLAKQRKENRERERTETGQEEHSQKEKWGGDRISTLRTRVHCKSCRYFCSFTLDGARAQGAHVLSTFND